MGKECRTALGVNGKELRTALDVNEKGVQDCVGCEWKRSADVGAGSVNVIYNTHNLIAKCQYNCTRDVL